MSRLIRAIRGFKDVPPEEAFRHRYVEETATDLFRRHGYREIRLPVVEATELFTRGIGENTDIVEKEMYTFGDRNGTSLTLRPEGTASAVRAYLEGGWKAWGGIAKVYYLGPMFRHERPQKGRFRQFQQIGLEAIGGEGPLVDAEVIAVLSGLFASLEVWDVRMLINSLGCPRCRPAYREELVRYLSGVEEGLCSDCARRSRTNPMRVLDCKVPGCREAVKGAPLLVDHLCGHCREHFSRVREALDGLGVEHLVDPRIVRGLDYYSRTAFEAVCDRLGAQNAVAAGGRYDGLADEIGGKAPGIGFAVGVERLAMLVDWSSRLPPSPDFFIAAATPSARVPCMELAGVLRGMNYIVLTDLGDRSLKAQLRSADRAGVGRVVIIGEDEMNAGTVQVKDFVSGNRETVPRDRFLAALSREDPPLKGEG